MINEQLSINEIVEYGLDNIDPIESINVNLKDLLYMYKAIEEFIRFFHQPMHFERGYCIDKYIGDRDEGAFSVMGNIYYKIFERMLPENIKDIVEDDNFRHPQYPFYYKEHHNS